MKRILILLSVIMIINGCPFVQERGEGICSALSLLCEINIYFIKEPENLQYHNQFLINEIEEQKAICNAISTMKTGLTCDLRKNSVIRDYLMNPNYYVTENLEGEYYELEHFQSFVNLRLIPLLRYIDINDFLPFKSVLSTFVHTLFKIPLILSKLNDCLISYCIVGINYKNTQHYIYSQNKLERRKRNTVKLYDQQNSCSLTVKIKSGKILTDCHYQDEKITIKDIKAFSGVKKKNKGEIN